MPRRDPPAADPRAFIQDISAALRSGGAGSNRRALPSAGARLPAPDPLIERLEQEGAEKQRKLAQHAEQQDAGSVASGSTARYSAMFRLPPATGKPDLLARSGKGQRRHRIHREHAAKAMVTTPASMKSGTDHHAGARRPSRRSRRAAAAPQPHPPRGHQCSSRAGRRHAANADQDEGVSATTRPRRSASAPSWKSRGRSPEPGPGAARSGMSMMDGLLATRRSPIQPHHPGEGEGGGRAAVATITSR